MSDINAVMHKYICRDEKTAMRLKYAIGGTFAFSMAANAFAYFNFYPQHDALNYVFNFAGSWEVSLGRFLLPAIEKVRGGVAMPWLSGLMSMVFIALAVYVITDLLEIDRPVYILIVGGLLSANLTITDICGVYLYVAGSYMLAMLLACMGVWFLVKNPTMIGMIPSCLCLFLSYGIYQAFCSVALTLLVFLVIKDCVSQDRTMRQILPRWGLYILALVISVILYIIFYQLALKYYGMEAANSYNSLSGLAGLSLHQLLSNMKGGYIRFFAFFFGKNTSLGVLARYCNIFLTGLAFLLGLITLVKRRLHVIRYIIIAVVILLLPGIMLLTGIMIGETSISFLYAYALFLLYPAELAIIARQTTYLGQRDFKLFRYIAVIATALLLIMNITYSNGAYTVQKVIYDRAMSSMTRILDDIEEDSDYIGGETHVIVIGTFSGNGSSLSSIPSKYSALNAFHNSSITYTQTMESFASLLGDDFNRERDSEVINQYQNSEIVQEMPVYPKNGYCQMIDGYMVIKLSE